MTTPPRLPTGRPDKHEPATMGFGTQSVHSGNDIDAGTGALRTPIVMANSYELPDDPSTLSWSGTGTGLYTRNTGINQLGLQRKLAVLEHGEEAVALASGVAALHAVFFTLLESGDHVVVANVTYEAVYRLFTDLLTTKYGILATFVDSTDLDAVRAAIRPETRLVHVETVGNPTTTVTDIAEVAAIAHAAGALLSVDNTFTPPPLFRPLDHGADLVVHSLTKYINGHGDAMGGAVVGRAELIRQIKLDAMVDVGGVISPFNAWLIMRGSVTLPLRIRQHCASALAVAEFLEADPRVAYVAYPGLPSHPQHEVAARQLPNGFGGMMAFAVQGDADAQNRFVAALRVITSAVSLGHDETLIVHVDGSGPRVTAYPPEFRQFGHLRLSVGLEDTADLLADLAAALDETFSPTP
ncbi:cystathionine gamma-lyase [Cryobacterium sp. MLB-32]|uniref:trans-sulfuration enzyme family protein n=1 Tax=Cryobacterium sp. MLB-32 TaxID=1529318 RepID=UPI0004E73774|nr:aminotransferase class I/II-fold pyridoxal phosphate-dependent enzyme [Cryobacterium sp. MLB-32]KFF60877.1 cystathionine gamma-lyase [Cryobacterium sp. MLB-32]